MNIRGMGSRFSQKSGETEKPVEQSDNWGMTHSEAESLRFQAMQAKKAQIAEVERRQRVSRERAIRSGNVAQVRTMQGQQFLVPMRGGVPTAQEYGTTLDDFLNPRKRKANAAADKANRAEIHRIRQAHEMGKVAEAAGLLQSRNERRLRAMKLKGDKGAREREAQAIRQKSAGQRNEQRAKVQIEAQRQIEARNMRMRAAVAAADNESAQVQKGQSKRYQAAAKQSRSGIYAVQNSTNAVASPFASFKSGGYDIPQMGGADFGGSSGANIEFDAAMLGIRKTSEVW